MLCVKNIKNYSVLMSVYYKEKPEYLNQAIESIQAQTFPTNDFVLVCDGPLTPGLNTIISIKKREFGSTLKEVRLNKNMGLGKALNEGLKYCKNELVARMDSDDIAYPTRCEEQVKIFEKNSEISICSGIVEEFTVSTSMIESRRVVPEKNEEIIQFAQKRNPYNHPCVMYKKIAVESVGSYQDFYLLEDYYLWLRMIMAGYKGYNIQKPLLYMRAGSDMYKRRSGWQYAQSQLNLLKYMKKNNFIKNSQYLKGCVIRSGSSLAPNWLRKFMFERILREAN